MISNNSQESPSDIHSTKITKLSTWLPIWTPLSEVIPKKLKKGRRIGKRWALQGVEYSINMLVWLGHTLLPLSLKYLYQSLRITSLLGQKVERELGFYFSTYGGWVGALILVTASIAQFNQQFWLFSHHPQAKMYQYFNYWPTLPFTTIHLAQVGFRLGNEQVTVHYLEQAQSQLGNWDKMGVGWLFRPYYNQVYHQLEVLQQKRRALDGIQTQLDSYPYALSLLWQKAQLAAELFYEEELVDTLKIIHWVNPLEDTSLLDNARG